MVVPSTDGVSQRGPRARASACFFSAAVPVPPLMIAPAWPMRRPGGAVCPAMKATTGLVTYCFTYPAASSSARPPPSLRRAADLADHDDGLGLRIGLERREAVDKVRPRQRIAADADRCRLPDVARLPDRLVRQRSGARDNADRARAVDVPGHDADL